MTVRTTLRNFSVCVSGQPLIAIAVTKCKPLERLLAAVSHGGRG
jgi:hypothetical protein